MNKDRYPKLRAALLQSVALILPIAMGLSACGAAEVAGVAGREAPHYLRFRLPRVLPPHRHRLRLRIYPRC